MSLYPPPKLVHASAWSQLPERLIDLTRRSAWIDANKPGAQMGSFLEGPTFDRAGALYVCDIPFGRILRITPEAAWEEVATYDGWPNGLALHRDGRLFIADYRHGILSLDPTTGRIAEVVTSVNSEGFKGVNDLTFDSQGRLYFTDQGQTGQQDPTGRVYRFDEGGGTLTCLLDTCPSPNGLVLSPDETVLYVAMTRGNAIWRVPLHGAGAPAKVGIFAQMAGGISGADGMAMAQDGTLAVADAGNGCVWTFSAFAEPLERILSPLGGRTVTNLAYGGPGRRTLYVTDATHGAILRYETSHPGQPLFGESDAA